LSLFETQQIYKLWEVKDYYVRRARTRAEDLHKLYLKGISVTSKLELNKNIPILTKGAQECHSSVCQGLTGGWSVFEFKFLKHRPMVCRKYSYFEVELGIDDKRSNLVDTGSEASWVHSNQPALIALRCSSSKIQKVRNRGLDVLSF
jgi:hypothetical protein